MLITLDNFDTFIITREERRRVNDLQFGIMCLSRPFWNRPAHACRFRGIESMELA